MSKHKHVDLGPGIALEMWPIADIIPYETNAKLHTPEQVTKIATSIARGGFDQPIVVDRYGVIIKGHGRRLALMELQRETAMVIVRRDLDPEQVKAARLADNRVAQGDYDLDMLRDEIAELADGGELTGIFDSKELEFIPADLGAMNIDAFVTDMGEVLAEQKEKTDATIAAHAGTTVRVTVAKALGFRDVAAADQIVLTGFMARAEAATGKKNDEAFIAYIQSLEVSQQ